MHTPPPQQVWTAQMEPNWQSALVVHGGNAEHAWSWVQEPKPSAALTQMQLGFEGLQSKVKLPQVWGVQRLGAAAQPDWPQFWMKS
jgi:hypothetical protein